MKIVESYVAALSDVSLMMKGVINKAFPNVSTPLLCAILVVSFIVYEVIYHTMRIIYSGKGTIKAKVFRAVTSLPVLKGIVKKQIDDGLKSINESVHGKVQDFKYLSSLPDIGLNEKNVLSQADKYTSKRTLDYRKGYASGTVYVHNEELDSLMSKMFHKFMWSNPLHPDIFPDVRRMEAEVVRMVLTMYNGDENTCGTMTSGGTESILMACRVYKQLAVKRGIKRPNMIVPDTVHAAFDKAADYFEMDIIHVPVDKNTRKVNVRKMAKAINRNTCMLAVSAPGFPHGIIDPIEEVALLGEVNGIPVHVDACLGGFLLPFMGEAGFSVPPFDFRLSGVTSISCDTHKYGMAPKGTSVIMYRDASYRSEQFFVAPDWTGGVYASPSIAGSRPGSLIALTWATMMHYGQNGYVESTKRIVSTARKIAKGISRAPGIKVLGEPLVNVVGFTSDVFDIYRLSDALAYKERSDLNWALNILQFPPSIHLCVTDIHTQPGCAERFIDEVTDAAAALMKTKGQKSSGMAAIYGASQMVPDRNLIETMAKGFLEACYSTPEPTPSN